MSSSYDNMATAMNTKFKNKASVQAAAQQFQHKHGPKGKGGNGKVPVNLYDKFTARLDTAHYPDFELHVFQDGQPYGDFGPSGWFAKNGGVAVPSDPPAKLQQLLKDTSVAFMKSAGTLKDGDSTDGDKWKRPAGKC